ncbi:MAG: hypothetical protein IK088_02375, partial [Lachnospiraceae bacterium]|nr:hypothetical protein [Lachnospiraceae bacterium]
MGYLIGLDIGTSSIKGVLMDQGGTVKKTARVPFTYLPLGPNRSELDPTAYTDVCFSAIRTLAEAADGEVLAVTASSASGNLILVGENGEPLTNILGWQNNRVTNEVKEVFGEIDREAYYRRIGWPLEMTDMPLAELCYLKVHDPERLAKAKTVAMSTEYLCFKMTGKWGISRSNGVTFYIIDRTTGEYVRPVIDKLGITLDQLPPVFQSGTVLGTVTREASPLTGLPEGTPVVLGSFDHPSAARGAGVLEEGQMLLSLGTSWVAFYPIRDGEKAFEVRGLYDPFLSPSGCAGVMSSVASLAGRLESYTSKLIDDGPEGYKTLSALAKESVPGANGLTIDLFDEPDESLLKTRRKEDIARAVMEGAVSLLKKHLTSFKEKGIFAEEAVLVGGPSEDPFWLELIETITGIRVKPANGSYTGAVGA